MSAGSSATWSDPGPMFKTASKPDDPGRFVEDFCNWQRIDEYRAIAFDSRAADAAGELMGQSSRPAISRPHAGQRTRDPPGHTVASGPALLQRRRSRQLLDVDARGPGGRRVHAGIRCRITPSRLADAPVVHGLPGRSGSPREPWRRFPRSRRTARITTFAAGQWEPGDVVFFHMLTLHHSYGVPGTRRRRAFSLRFLGDDMVHAPRQWRCSPDFDQQDLAIAAGSPMDGPLFPVLRTLR